MIIINPTNEPRDGSSMDLRNSDRQIRSSPLALPWLNGRSLWVLALGIMAIMLFSLERWQLSAGWIGFDAVLVVAGYLAQRYNQFLGPASWVEFLEVALRFWQYLISRYLVLIFLLVPLAIWILLPHELTRLYRDIVASGVLVSNLTAWQDRVFLYGVVETSPMAHTWLVSLVAQFVLATLVIHRLARRHMLPLMLAGAVVSFGIAVWAFSAIPSASFYFPVTRFWPFALGMVTVMIAPRITTSRAVNLLITIVGFTLIILVFKQPGLYLEQGIAIQLAGVIGICLLLLPRTQSNRRHEVVLSTLVLLYLLHHPLVAVLKTLGAGDDLVLVLALSMLFPALAVTHRMLHRRLCWARPWRFKPLTWTALMFAAAVSSWGMAVDGKILRNYPDQIFGLETVSDSVCYGVPGSQSSLEDPCVLGGAKVRVAIIGDGHAATLFNPLNRSLREVNTGMRAFAGPYCVPLYDLINIRYSDRQCAGSTSNALNEIRENPDISLVVLYAQWANYTKGSRDGNPPSLVSYRGREADSIEENPRLFASAFDETISSLVSAGKQVLLVTSTPEFDLRVLDERARNWLLGSHFTPPRVAISSYFLRNREVLDLFDRYARHPQVSVLEAQSLYCAEGLCEAMDPNGQVLFSDNSHLAGHGAELLADRILSHVTQAISLKEVIGP